MFRRRRSAFMGHHRAIRGRSGRPGDAAEGGHPVPRRHQHALAIPPALPVTERTGSQTRLELERGPADERRPTQMRGTGRKPAVVEPDLLALLLTVDGVKIQGREVWTLSERLGGGGFGQVFRAVSDDGQLAAAKLVPKAPGAERELLFEQLSDVPNVVPIIDTAETVDAWALVMPLAERSLADEIAQRGPLPLDQALVVLIDIATALAALEGIVVHRDLKPQNVLLLAGRWCLADFGIARYAEASTAPDTRKFAMSMPYPAPERWRGERATAAADVYSLGVMAHVVLAGVLPFSGPSDHEFREQHLHADPPPLAQPRRARLGRLRLHRKLLHPRRWHSTLGYQSPVDFELQHQAGRL